ncbi:MAG: AAA family ATPase [Lacipirellulaceae bacterium]
MSAPVFLSRVQLRNYKSIGRCDVRLGRMTMLVGRNGSGKSNFIDALRFVLEGLQTSLDHAIRSRGGIDVVRRKSQGHPHNFAIRLSYDLEDGVADYGFEIAARKGRGYVVKRESLTVLDARAEVRARYRVEDGEVDTVATTANDMPPAASDRLYLVTASGRKEFRAPYDALCSMGFYNLNPAAMRDVHSPDAGQLLRRDGSNIASVVSRIEHERPELKRRVNEYLGSIAPGVVGFDRVGVGPKETLEFRQEVRGSKDPWRFHAASMSDGTLRALGVLVAALQLTSEDQTIKLVGIEEPESALHPSAASALVECLRAASDHTQVVLTTHSPDLLDGCDPNSDTLLVIEADQGESFVAALDDASLEAIRQHLYTPGELLRLEQLQASLKDKERQLSLAGIWDEGDG